MPRYLAVLEYDGTDFSGSQVQANRRTVQGELERALQVLAGARSRVALAGRTDAGVHAWGQVAAFDLWRPLDSRAASSALNALLPRDVSVREVAQVEAEFDPRRWAAGRRYVYRILNRRQRSALVERCAWHVPEPLDLEAMCQASRVLAGWHDFGAFGRPPQGNSTWRRLLRLDVSAAGDLVVVLAEADAFLRRMVRLLAGALVDVGRGRRLPADLERAIIGDGLQDRVSSAAPAKGLALAAVAYERERLGLGAGPWWSSEPLGGTG